MAAELYFCMLLIIYSIPNVCCIICDKAYSEFTSCAVDFAKDDPNRYPWGVDFERFQSSVSQCFTDFGCLKIKLLSPQQVFDDAEKYLYNCKPQEELLRLRRRKRSFRSVPLVNRAPVNLTDWPSKSLFVGDTDLLIECKRKVRSAVREDVQECGRRLLGQNFTVPCENDEKIAEIPLDVLLIDNYYSTAVFNLTQDKSICLGTTDPDFAYKLRQCISNVFNKARDYPGWNLFEKRAREYSVSTCNARCLEKLGDCKDSLEETTLALCKCIPDDKRSAYRTMLGDCYPALKENEFILDTIMARDINIVRSHVCITKATDPCS